MNVPRFYKGIGSLFLLLLIFIFVEKVDHSRKNNKGIGLEVSQKSELNKLETEVIYDYKIRELEHLLKSR